jgi:hypothetical protein
MPRLGPLPYAHPDAFAVQCVPMTPAPRPHAVSRRRAARARSRIVLVLLRRALRRLAAPVPRSANRGGRRAAVTLAVHHSQP